VVSAAGLTPVEGFELILGLMAVIIALELVSRKLGLPPAAAFILGGIGLALDPHTPDVELDPELALVLFLPPLLTAGAYFTVWRDFRANLHSILGLALGAVAFTTLVVGAVTRWVDPSLPWAVCLALGAIVAPPDAVAAKAVLQGAGLPRRMTVLLEGESLVNDATGLVLYRFAVAAALTGAFSWGQAAAQFAAVAAGGVAAGAAIGWVGSSLIGRLRDPTLAIVASLLLSWGSYIAGERLHVSGVLCTVAAGLVVGWRQHTVLSAEMRVDAKAVWGVVVFVLESLVFILIGLSLSGVLERLDGDWTRIGAWMPAALAVTGAVVVSRFVWIFPAAYLTRALFPALRRRDPYPPIGAVLVMSWAGMRGVVSLAAALALPEGFQARDFILATTFVVILATVLLPGLTLAPLIRAFRLNALAGGGGAPMTETEARARVAAAQSAAVEQLAAQASGGLAHPRLREQYAWRAQAAARFHEAAGGLDDERAAHFGVVLAAVRAGREEALRLHRSRDIHDEVLHSIEQQLDLEELNARRYAEHR
jgi:CPA1 family monovalent cation:H+ antiporter